MCRERPTSFEPSGSKEPSELPHIDSCITEDGDQSSSLEDLARVNRHDSSLSIRHATKDGVIHSGLSDWLESELAQHSNDSPRRDSGKAWHPCTATLSDVTATSSVGMGSPDSLRSSRKARMAAASRRAHRQRTSGLPVIRVKVDRDPGDLYAIIRAIYGFLRKNRASLPHTALTCPRSVITPDTLEPEW